MRDSAAGVPEGRLLAMRDALVHRGPDGAGLLSEPGIGLGHRRLSIIDIEGGAQPFDSADGRICLCFNGEIYNFRDLRTNLEKQGHKFRTHSDTEVLAELWAAEGVACLTRLNGMFAFAVWDRRNRELTLVRDRMGEKPLYYGIAPDGNLYFASELKALLAADVFGRKIDPQALAEYFALGYVPDPASIIEGIFKLPPGHFLTLKAGGVPVLSRWWQLSVNKTVAGDRTAWTEELQSRIDRAVRRQMISDVPLGAFLSGGVDSSTIVAAMAEDSARPVATCAIGFDAASHDERHYARQVAELFHTDHSEFEVAVDAHDLIPEIARVYDEPFADTSALPTWHVCRMARDRVTVALTGDGGDEVFCGYRRYPFFGREERAKALLPGAVRTPLFGGLGAIWPKADFLPQKLRLKTTLQAFGESRAAGYFRAASINLPDRVAQIWSPDFAEALSGSDPVRRFERLLDEADTDDPVLAAQYIDMHSWLPGRMLVKTDRASMAHSLELRPPLLDHELVSWVFSLPTSAKLADGEGKWLLKEAGRTRLPENILFRKKRGFDPPVANWLRAANNNPLERLDASDRWKDAGHLDPAAVGRMRDDHLAGRRDCSQELWTVLMYDAFLETL